MIKQKIYTAEDPGQLAELIGLDPADAIEIEFRAKLNKKIIDTVKSRKLTHEQAALLAKTSRTRMTAILNANTTGVSSDLLLRILYSLGFKAKISFETVRIAA